MRYDFTNEQVEALMMSLILRRMKLRDFSRESATLRVAYAQELEVVESLIDQLVPGSLARIKMADQGVEQEVESIRQGDTGLQSEAAAPFIATQKLGAV